MIRIQHVLLFSVSLVVPAASHAQSWKDKQIPQWTEPTRSRCSLTRRGPGR